MSRINKNAIENSQNDYLLVLSRRCSDILCQGGRIHFTFFFRNHKYFDIFLHRKTDHIKQLEKNVNQSNFVIHEKKYYFYIFGLCCGRQAKRTQWTTKNVWFICIWFFTVVLISLWQQQKKLCSLLFTVALCVIRFWWHFPFTFQHDKERKILIDVVLKVLIFVNILFFSLNILFIWLCSR